ncbi:conserved hypothetical protein [Catenulispora acidiphila DSM 44928]|uniref:SHOCT domain-containing protein n=1 Tax=Catenulispora acidiphila (strain DSM 44928 / JCM 14897 / NBRC 102108 / NRRL B-24433 / ID139908) TaxID=479433 RepID=C7Q492_CATAD|nr:DUF4429 domain-containing protein [Catenulispora acidiphila]ACU69952.1 conserved hypothetical protein [Catenulispora acidiphila DSM 44928]
MIETKGHNGQVQFDGEFVTIARKGFLARSSVGKGVKRIHLSQIAAVQWKPAGFAVNGFIRFTVPGGIETRARFGSRTTSAAKDENSVIFTQKQQPAFAELRDAVESAIAARGQVAAPTSAGMVADELAKLQGLLDQGVLSPEEFSQQKARLLG